MLQKMMKKREGFTLIELMIVVVIIGILAAIAVPAFIRFLTRSKTSEAQGMLGQAYDGAQTYYQTEHWGQRVQLTGAQTATTHCVVATGESAGPASPSGNKEVAVINPNGSFAALSFSFSGPVYFKYTIASDVPANGCGNGPSDEQVYTFTANGNLDGDNVPSTFELAVGSNEDNSLFHAPGLYVVNELE